MQVNNLNTPLNKDSSFEDFKAFYKNVKELADNYSELTTTGGKIQNFSGRPGKFYLTFENNPVGFTKACVLIEKFNKEKEFRIANNPCTIEIQSPHLALVHEGTICDLFKTTLNINSNESVKISCLCNFLNTGLKLQPEKKGWDYINPGYIYLNTGYGYQEGSALSYYKDGAITSKSLQETIALLPMPEKVKFELCQSLQFGLHKTSTGYYIIPSGSVKAEAYVEIVNSILKFPRINVGQLLMLQCSKADSLSSDVWGVITKFVAQLVMKEFSVKTSK